MAHSKISVQATKQTKSKSTSEPQSMAELLAAHEKPLVSLKRRQQVEGTVLKVSPTEIILDLGSKAEGIISGRELLAEAAKNVKVGDTLSVTVIENESDNNYVLCSLKTFTETKKYSQIKDSFDTDNTIEVKVVEERKGGYLVNYNGLRGFLPASQVALEFVGKPKELVNSTIQVKVLEFDRDIPRLIVSQKAVVSPEVQAMRKQFFGNVSIGKEVEGKVVAVLPFGLVVDVAGIEGFVHISEIAWERVDNPQNYYHVGDKVRGLILSIDEEEGKITLSIKQLTRSPWTTIEERYKVDQQVTGTVSKKTSFGVLIRLNDGLMGMIHKSKLTSPDDDTFQEGSAVTCTIESIDKEAKKISLVPA